jgi:hypothetical protein
MNFQKSIFILKPGTESNAANANANEHDSEPDALELFKRDARMHICKYKHEENRNKILKRRLIIRKQLQSNPHLEDIVRMYDNYYEEFKTKITMQIGALERLLRYLKNLESSKHKTHYHHHHHHHHNVERDKVEDEDEDDEYDEYDEDEDDEYDEDEQGKNVEASVKKKVPSAIVAGIKRDQKLIFKEIRKLKNMLQMKGSNREAKYKELSKYIDKIDGETNQTDSNLFKIKREQEQILQTLGEITKDVNQSDKL